MDNSKDEEAGVKKGTKREQGSDSDGPSDEEYDAQLAMLMQMNRERKAEQGIEEASVDGDEDDECSDC